jgi:hypothetical protein
LGGIDRKPFLAVSEAFLALNVRVETLRRWIEPVKKEAFD